MNKPFDFYVIPDLHMIPPTLNLTKEQRFDQRCMMETIAIHKAVFSDVLADKAVDVIIVPGDLTNSGELEAHKELVKELKEIEAQGKKVFVISAAHDYCEKTRFEGFTPTDRDAIPVMYRQFMHDKAISVAPDGHSYNAMLTDGVMILALNDDKKPEKGVEKYGFDKATLEWIESECNKANERGDIILAMTHHPLLPPNSLYPVIAKGDMIMNWEEIATFLADCGVKYMFTGHSHMHNIAEFVSAKGNKLYDLNTASIVGYPHAYRKCRLDENGMEVKTLQAATYDWHEIGDRTANEYAYDNFKRLLDREKGRITSGADGLADIAKIKPEKAKKLRPILSFASSFIDKLTVKKLGKLVGAGKKIPTEVADRYFKDVIIELVLQMYRGDESYTPDTPLYIALDNIFCGVEKICKRIGKDSICNITGALRGGFLYNVGPDDWNTYIS